MGDGNYIGYTGPETLDVTGIVSVDNLSEIEISNVTIAAMPSVTVAGGTLTAAVSFPVTQTVEGTVNVSGVSPNLIDSNNSTTTPLSSGATWTGTATDISQFTTFTVTVKTDQDSTADGFVIQQSTDGTNWDDNHTYTLQSGVARRYQFPVTAQYYRVKLTNSTGAAQSYLRVQSIAHRENTLYSIHKVESDYETGDRTCQLVKSVLQAKKPDNSYTNIDCTTGGNLKVSIEEVDNGAQIPITPGTEYLSTAAINLDANGSNPITDSQILAAQGAGNKSIIHGIQIQVTGSSGKGYWFITDGAYSSDTASNVKAQGAMDTGGGVTNINLTFPFGLDMTANTAINITTTELTGQVYVVGTIYYKVV